MPFLPPRIPFPPLPVSLTPPRVIWGIWVVPTPPPPVAIPRARAEVGLPGWVWGPHAHSLSLRIFRAQILIQPSSHLRICLSQYSSL